MIAWMIVNIEVYSTKNEYIWYFTHWNVVLVSLYFFFSFAVTLHGFMTQKNGKVQGQFIIYKVFLDINFQNGSKLHEDKFAPRVNFVPR